MNSYRYNASTPFKSGTDRLKNAIRDVPDFPKEGIVFKDLSPVLEDRQLFRLAISMFNDRYQRRQIDTIIGIEARGFIFGSALAYVLGCGFTMVRKKGKLPHKCLEASYDLEYGSNVIEIHEDSLEKGMRVLVIDDVLATGGTMKAAIELAQRLETDVVEAATFIELEFLKGREKLGETPVFSLITY
ncbi:MAG: adenine phosphoribosyltransferase [Verrucomicrobiota bacterium]